MNTLRDRFDALPAASVADRLVLRAGTLRDDGALAGFHYLNRRPATATRVLALVDEAETVTQRARRAGMRGARDRPAADDRVVGVLVESLPALGCALRDEALGGRYGRLDRRDAARLLNAEMRCISRVVVHPQWRGLGLAVRLVREALATMTTPYCEALAAMGRVHPFFELAGMTAYRRWPHDRDQRLLDALSYTGVEPWQLASAARMRRHVDTPVVRAELCRWAGRGVSIDAALRAARERLLCEPVYYLAGRE